MNVSHLFVVILSHNCDCVFDSRVLNSFQDKQYKMAASKPKTLEYAWCFTGQEPDEETTFNWKVDNFKSRMGDSAQNVLVSDPFMIKEETFKLELYPKGHTNDAQGFVG